MLTVEANKKALQSSERALLAVKAQYDIGSRDMIDVVDAQKQFFASQKDYAHARINYALDLLQLKLFVGELSENDLQDLNQWLVVDPAMLTYDKIP